MAEGKVLLIDDEQDFINALSERMENRGIKSETANSGGDALSKIDDQNFDCIVLDMVMPGMDGIETLRKLLEKNPDLHVILLTGHATVQKSVEALKLGAADFLEKPAKVDELVRIIKEGRARRVALAEEHAQDLVKDIMKTKGW